MEAAYSPTFRERLLRDWYLSRGTVLTTLLLPLSWLFRLIVSIRRAAYRRGLFDTRRLPVPVIVVGNLTVGGTGKTPLVAWLADELRARKLRPGIVARGYGGANTVPRAVTPDDDPRVVGDEPILLAQKGIPVWVGHDRVATARALLEAEPRVSLIISDDGLQHYRLARDMEILVVDGTRGFGNGRMLPAGPMREPHDRVTAVDAIVVNNAVAERMPFTTRPPMYMMHLSGEEFVSLAEPARTASADAFAGKRVQAIAGIGNPGRFFDSLRKLGLDPVCHVFPDHHAYAREDVEYRDADIIVMTDKDAIKCRGFADPRMWRLPVAASVGPGLVEGILEKVHGH